MKIFGILIIKNEVDIVEMIITKSLVWCDKIFILDNGSTDGTWEILKSMENDRIVVWKQYFGEYSEGLRADVYNNFKYESKNGDWWCFKLDSDEFYVQNPREFLTKIPYKYQLVAKKSLDYMITEEDVTEYNFTGNFEIDINYIRYINPICWSEPRFFRYRDGLKWIHSDNAHWPQHAGVLYDKEFILVKHYQFRSPQQMQKRLDVRNSLKAKQQGKTFKHIKEREWQELLKKRENLVYDDEKIDTYTQLRIKNLYKQNTIKKIIKWILIFLKIYK